MKEQKHPTEMTSKERLTEVASILAKVTKRTVEKLEKANKTRAFAPSTGLHKKLKRSSLQTTVKKV